MASNFDLAIVGSGSAAAAVAAGVLEAGWHVVVIDHRAPGGTCALRGCDAKKLLLSGAQAVDQARRMAPHGVSGEVHVDWQRLMSFKRAYTNPIPERTEARYAERGIAWRRGRARFVERNSLQVNGEVVQASHVVLAVGAEPVALGMPGEEHAITSEAFLELDPLPRRIVLVGGGYIAAEFAHVAAAAGSGVTVLQRAPRMLTHFDPDLVDVLMESFRHLGVDVRTSTQAQGIEKNANGFSVLASSTEGRMLRFDADLVVHAGGRKPDLRTLDLDAGHVAVHDGKLALNEHLQSVSNPAVYAAGDAAQKGPPLTPVAAHDGRVVAANLLHGNRRKPNYAGVPSVAFTLPPIAAVGLNEVQAREQGLRFRTRHERSGEWYSARRVAQPVQAFKVLIEEGSERLLGAHFVGPHAEDVINLFALAIRNGLRADDLKDALFAYPTGASDIAHML